MKTVVAKKRMAFSEPGHIPESLVRHYSIKLGKLVAPKEVVKT